MKKIQKIKQALVGFRGSVLRFYNDGVHKPVQFWVACGSPSSCVPRLPWWQPWVWAFISIMGWNKYFPRRKMTEQEWLVERAARYEARASRVRLH
ncbi:MAG: hypothetical protein JWO95_1541 [Verrucomicrobiales bacterium]|nr:hypothetical protein [Verrucomicrobiales bacterium]